jgi:hypothetical protein
MRNGGECGDKEICNEGSLLRKQGEGGRKRRKLKGVRGFFV